MDAAVILQRGADQLQADVQVLNPEGEGRGESGQLPEKEQRHGQQRLVVRQRVQHGQVAVRGVSEYGEKRCRYEEGKTRVCAG